MTGCAGCAAILLVCLFLWGLLVWALVSNVAMR